MFRFLFLLALAALVSALTACATPRYEATSRYEPPVGAEGLACIRSCEATLSACRSDCQAAWQACTARVEPQVEEGYARALKAYADELRRYRLALDRYAWDMWLGWGHGYGGLGYSPWSYYPWPGYFPAPAPPPQPPTRETVRANLHQAQCQDDCGCQAKYDACYQGCGGRVVSETRCVANCPAGK